MIYGRYFMQEAPTMVQRLVRSNNNRFLRFGLVRDSLCQRSSLSNEILLESKKVPIHAFLNDICAKGTGTNGIKRIF